MLVNNSNKNSLKKNYIYNLINQVLVLIVPLITSPYLARVLLEEGNGRLSYANSIITYFILFANLGFSIYGQREIAKKRDNQYEKSKVFWEIIILRSFCTLISIIIWGILLLTIGFGEKYNQLILILGIQIFGVFIDITFYYQGVENFKGIAIRSIIVKLIGLICIFIFVKTSNDLWKYALSLSLITIFSNIIMWPNAIKQIKYIQLNKLNLKENIVPSLLIFLPTLAVTIYSVLDKTMIGILSNNPDYDNGCYEQAYKINSIALILVTVISPIMIPRNTYDYNKKNFDSLKNHIYFSCSYVWLIGFPLIAGFGVLSKNLSSWFLGDGYAEVPTMLIIMSIRFIASGLGVTFGDQYFIAIGKEKYCTMATTIAAIVNFCLNLIFIPWLGGIGAAITTAIAEMLVTFVLIIFISRENLFSIKHIFILGWKNLLSSVIMFIAIYFIQKFLPYNIWTFILITSIGGIIYFLILYILKDHFFIELISTFFNSIKDKFSKKIVLENNKESSNDSYKEKNNEN